MPTGQMNIVIVENNEFGSGTTLFYVMNVYMLLKLIYKIYELHMTTILFYLVCQYFIFRLHNDWHLKKFREHPTHKIIQYIIALFHIQMFGLLG
jgi:hypothetical protein